MPPNGTDPKPRPPGKPVTDPPAHPEPAAEPMVTMADVAPLTGAPAPVPAATRKPFLSEGMRHDLEAQGWAVDPVSGARFELNRETGEVTVIEKGGRPGGEEPGGEEPGGE